MANHKAPGGDGVAAELLKYCDPHGKELLLLLSQPDTRPRVHLTGLEGGILVLTPKSGDLADCSNYRGLTLLRTITKLFAHLLLQRVRPHVPLNDH
jgi:hypothetical protein